MAFTANPLALSVPDAGFESWLRDTGFLELLDQRTSDLRRPSSAPTTNSHSTSATTTDKALFLSNLGPLLTLNPFSKLTAYDFSGETPSWTTAFIGSFDSYTRPSSPDQARLRVHENVKRYARNYASLFVLFFACSLYQIPVALVGSITSLAFWELFTYFSHHWGVDQYPFLRHIFLRILQCGTVVILFYSNVQMALFCAVAVSYAVMITHASFRKLSPAKQPTRGRWK